MSNTTIHYVTFDSPEKVLIRESEFENQEYVYSKCPVHNHKQNRVFVGLSPIDFSLRVTRKTGEMNHIVCDDPNLITWDDEHVNSPKPVIQLKIPKWLFWTNEDDVWFDFYDHPMTALNNNFIAVRGWFNLSNWSRTSSLGMTIVDETKPVIIKKGDPLCRISFYPTNLDNTITMKEEKDLETIQLLEHVYNKKTDIGWVNKIWKQKLFSRTNETSKCPVGFLFK
tara:strand:- start:92 stop:766 length:675 start_codon:yes stop_codon:yes gene_type:complete